MLPCSTWAICGVVVGHCVPRSGWAAVCIIIIIIIILQASKGKDTKITYTLSWGGSYVVFLVNTNMCVARHVMLMMLLQLPGFWSWVGAAAVVVAVGCGF